MTNSLGYILEVHSKEKDGKIVYAVEVGSKIKKSVFGFEKVFPQDVVFYTKLIWVENLREDLVKKISNYFSRGSRYIYELPYTEVHLFGCDRDNLKKAIKKQNPDIRVAGRLRQGSIEIESTIKSLYNMVLEELVES